MGWVGGMVVVGLGFGGSGRSGGMTCRSAHAAAVVGRVDEGVWASGGGLHAGSHSRGNGQECACTQCGDGGMAQPTASSSTTFANSHPPTHPPSQTHIPHTPTPLADLVPREVAERWLKYLREELPAVAFKCSTQKQGANLGQRKLAAAAAQRAADAALKGAECLGGWSVGEWCGGAWWAPGRRRVEMWVRVGLLRRAAGSVPGRALRAVGPWPSHPEVPALPSSAPGPRHAFGTDLPAAPPPTRRQLRSTSPTGPSAPSDRRRGHAAAAAEELCAQPEPEERHHRGRGGAAQRGQVVAHQLAQAHARGAGGRARRVWQRLVFGVGVERQGAGRGMFCSCADNAAAAALPQGFPLSWCRPAAASPAAALMHPPPHTTRILNPD